MIPREAARPEAAEPIDDLVGAVAGNPLAPGGGAAPWAVAVAVKVIGHAAVGVIGMSDVVLVVTVW
jgi:hypothetical protein